MIFSPTDGGNGASRLIRPQFIRSVSDSFGYLQVLLPMSAVQNGQTVDAMDLFFKFIGCQYRFLGHSMKLGEPSKSVLTLYLQSSVQSIIMRVGPLNRSVPRRMQHHGVHTTIHQQTLRYVEKKSKSDEGYNFLYALATRSHGVRTN